MTVISDSFQIPTSGFGDAVDLTGQVQNAVRASGLSAGLATVFIAGSTAGITAIEYESGVIEDLRKVIEELVPEDREYLHNLRWQDGNGFSHVRAALFKPDLTVPFSEGKLLLGTWQQIVLLDFDNRPRTRQVLVQILGE
jgi:secondary thiamine-phosphate synthase enzyme